MSREDYQQKLADEARVQPQTHKKMYKSKKRWVIAGMTALAVGGVTTMAPEEVTTLMSDVYQTAEEVFDGGVAYAASAATAAVNTTTAVTVMDSGVASVTSAATYGTLTGASANANMRVVGGTAAASGSGYRIMNGSSGAVQYNTTIAATSAFAMSGAFSTTNYAAGNFIGLMFAPTYAAGNSYGANGGNVGINGIANATTVGVDLWYDSGVDPSTAFVISNNGTGQINQVGIRQTNSAGSFIANTNASSVQSLFSGMTNFNSATSYSATISYAVSWTPVSVSGAFVTGSMTITMNGGQGAKSVTQTIALPSNVVMELVGNNGGTSTPATVTGSLAGVSATAARTPVNVTYVDGAGSALLSATSFTADNWTAVGITGATTPVATNAKTTFAAPSISGYSAVAVSYAANTNNGGPVASTTNLLVTSATANNNIQIQYKDIEAPKMSLTNTVTYQQNETINSSDMVTRLVTSLGDNSPKAVTTSLTSGSINTASAGTYQVQITATDAAGNATNSMATVTVLPKSVSAASSVASSASSDASSASSMISSATSAAKSSSASVEASSAS